MSATTTTTKKPAARKPAAKKAVVKAPRPNVESRMVEAIAAAVPVTASGRPSKARQLKQLRDQLVELERIEDEKVSRLVTFEAKQARRRKADREVTPMRFRIAANSATRRAQVVRDAIAALA